LIWLELQGKTITDADIKFIGDNKKTFVVGLNEADRYGFVAHDEAGKDLYARNSQSEFNRDLNVAYQVIRGANIYTVLVIPSILDLDTFFRRRRVTCMMHVYKEGKVAYFTKKRLRKLVPWMMMASKYNDDPDPMLAKDEHNRPIKALFTDTFPLFYNEKTMKPEANQSLYEAYLARKGNNIKQVKQELYDKYVKSDDMKQAAQKDEAENRAEAYKLSKAKVSNAQIAKIVGINARTVKKYIIEQKALEAVDV
jgi:hypothetical protein